MADGGPPKVRRGRLFVITAPSGAGKTTLLKGLMERLGGVVFSVSYTTRTPRSGEEHGRDYFFVTGDRFKEMIEAGDLAEWTETYGHFYGTGKRELDRILATGRDVILDLDLRGYLSVKKAFSDAVGVFISPPSLEVLEERLQKRGTESEGELKVRLDAAKRVMDRASDFEWVVVNDTAERATGELVRIIEEERKNR